MSLVAHKRSRTALALNDNLTATDPEDIRRLQSLVEEQARRLVALEHSSSSTKQSLVRRAGWGRSLGLIAVAGAIVVAATASAVAATPSPKVVGGGGIFTACYGTKTTVKFLAAPVRILDTRDGTGGVSGLRPAGSTTTVATSGTIPGAIGVIGNITVTGAASQGYLTVWPGGTQPNASTINYGPGWTIANHVQSALAGDGTFKIYNATSAHEIYDVTAGIYPVSKGLRLIDPATETCASDETMTTWSQTGPQGPQGPQGPAGVSGWHIVSGTATAIAGGGTLRQFIQCGTGEKVFGGGGQVVGEGVGPFNTVIAESDPSSAGAVYGWLTSMRNFDSASHTFQLFAVCGNAT
jgi:hypothetical protein